MLYLLAAIGALTVAVFLWRSLSGGRVEVAARRSPAPDDDPDFLRTLGEQRRRGRDEDDDAA